MHNYCAPFFGLEKAGGPQLRPAKARNSAFRVVRLLRKLQPAGVKRLF